MDCADVSVTSLMFTSLFQIEVEFRRIGTLYFADARKGFPDRRIHREVYILTGN
jgi:hypothetical protein